MLRQNLMWMLVECLCGLAIFSFAWVASDLPSRAAGRPPVRVVRHEAPAPVNGAVLPTAPQPTNKRKGE